MLDFPNIVNLESDADQNNRLFNFLLFLFPYYLKTAMRKGLFKKYVRNRYNDGNVKGTIDIARHIEQNTPITINLDRKAGQPVRLSFHLVPKLQ